MYMKNLHNQGRLMNFEHLIIYFPDNKDFLRSLQWETLNRHIGEKSLLKGVIFHKKLNVSQIEI